MTRAEDFRLTEQKIVRTAKELFMEQGYRAVSTRQIAQACALTQPALYHHFKDKQSIYMAVIWELTSNIRTAYRPLDFEAEEPSAILAKMFRILIQKHPTNIMLMVHDIFSQMDRENQVILINLWKKTYLDPFKQLFTRWSHLGYLRAELDADAAARYCLSSIVPMTSNRFSKMNKDRQNERINKVIDFLLHGLLK